MVSEPCQMNTIFLARYGLCPFALLDIKDMHGFVVCCCYEKVALVVKVEGREIDIGSILLTPSTEDL